MALVAHCILNQNAVVYPLARAKGGFSSIVLSYMTQEYGLYQLPCPELKYLNMYRKPMSKSDYDTAKYHQLCEQLAHDVIEDLKKYKEYGNNICYLHGIQESPTCSISGNRGHFMEVLIEKLTYNGFELEFKEVSTDYEE